MSETTPLLELIDVTKRYERVGGSPEADVLRGVSLTVERGQSVAISGPSGSGKSTLLNIIGAMDHPNIGRVLLDGSSLGELSEKQLAAVRRRSIGFVFQAHHLLPQCTALENVLVPTLACRNDGPAGDSESAARDLLERVGLGHRLEHRPGELSGGERQRVAVARALINEPDMVLADEPTGSLDQEAAEELAELLAQLNRDTKLTLIVVTHAPRLVARMERRLALRAGVLEPENES